MVMDINIKNILDEILDEQRRNNNFIHLTANENQMSNTARKFLSSKISERYFFGGGDVNNVVDMGHFTGLGFKGVDD